MGAGVSAPHERLVSGPLGPANAADIDKLDLMIQKFRRTRESETSSEFDDEDMNPIETGNDAVDDDSAQLEVKMTALIPRLQKYCERVLSTKVKEKDVVKYKGNANKKFTYLYRDLLRCSSWRTSHSLCTRSSKSQ
jgi:hypothetical protein